MTKDFHRCRLAKCRMENKRTQNNIVIETKSIEMAKRTKSTNRTRNLRKKKELTRIKVIKESRNTENTKKGLKE